MDDRLLRQLEALKNEARFLRSENAHLRGELNAGAEGAEWGHLLRGVLLKMGRIDLSENVASSSARDGLAPLSRPERPVRACGHVPDGPRGRSEA